jgi:hypothetical protein
MNTPVSPTFSTLLDNVRNRSSVHRSFLTLALAAVVALSACKPAPPPPTKGPLVIMTTNSLIKEGSIEECVYRQMMGGVRLEDALKECARLQPPAEENTITSAIELLGRHHPGVSQVSCTEGFANPRAEGHSPDYPEAKKAAIDIWTARMYIDAALGDAGLARAAQKQLNEASVKLQELEKKLKEKEKEETSRIANEGPIPDRSRTAPERPTPPSEGPGDFPTPNPDQPATARTNPDAENVCFQVAEFIGQCNRDGWGSPQCSEFMDRMKGCGDPRVTDPADPDRECGLPAVDPDKVKEVVMVLCTSRKLFVEGENPCGRVGPAGKALTYQYRPKQREGVIDCNDPRARFTGDSCLPTFTLASFGETDIRELLKEGFEKFGGPVFIIPLPSPEPNPEPGPEPRPGPK